jgi:hypothetical protein
MSFLGPNNALAWAHFRLRGGWPRSLAFTGGAVAILLMLIVGGVRLNPLDKSRILYGWSTGVLALMGAVVLLYIPGRISAAIRQDIQSKLIESHRLMPTPPLEAVAGYVTGAAMQPLVLCAALFTIGLFTCAGAQMDLSHWLMSAGVLMAFGAFAWVVAAYASFTARIGPGLFFIPMLFGPAALSGGGLTVLPGLLVLLSPIIGDSIFDLRATGTSTLPGTYAIAIAAQVYFGVICFLAASRKYRSSEAVGIDAILGLLLLAGWVGVTGIGLRSPDEYRPLRMGIRGMDADVPIITSMLLGLVLAIAPVAANAWARARWRRHEMLKDPAPMRRPLPVALIVAVATVLVVLIAFESPTLEPPAPVKAAQTAGAIAIPLLGLYYLFSFIYGAYPRAGIPAFVWVLLSWGVPVMVDLTLYGLSDYGADDPIGGVASCSPIGSLIVIWQRPKISPNPGLAMMALIQAIPFALWLTFHLRRRRAELAAA